MEVETPKKSDVVTWPWPRACQLRREGGRGTEKFMFFFPRHASDLDGRIKRELACNYRNLFKPSEVARAVPEVGVHEK